ncbi:beta strand repeat-containing protein [Rubripirellula lacrimiformis]|nr:filamentous hemagglutinin N-terminal domain-containing protein [Rubripirellula lacrimiformis]
MLLANNRKRLLLAAMIVGTAVPSVANAQSPTGGNIVAGAGVIDNSIANLTNITTTTDRAVINWSDFSVGQGHTVNFDQIHSNSAVLNKVVSGAPQSLINGAITSNGNVFVSNASGVVIGSTGTINTNGFTATTLDISNERFMSGNLSFSGSSSAAITNNGLISTGAGGAHLIASQVFNNGTIESTGTINLATGGRLKMAGGTYIQADLDTIKGGIAAGASLIGNSGTIRAIGGLNVGGEVYLVNPNGRIVNDATITAALTNPSGSQTGGKVEMLASTEAILNQGTIDVSGTTGGRVVVTGETVTLEASTIDASGELAGGDVRIGGGWKGQDAEIANANQTSVSADTVISADATVRGDAGTVVVWADGNTEFSGQINARALGQGNGGNAEVSGKDHLTFTGNADLRSASGQYGNLLLDPSTFTIDAGNEDAIRAQWGSSALTIEADNLIEVLSDLFPTVSSGGDEKTYADGSKTALTLREASSGDGAVNINIAAEIRDSRQGSAAVEFNAGTGTFTVTEDGRISSSLGGASDVTVTAGEVDVAGASSIDKLIATGDATVGLGTGATGQLNLSDDDLAHLSVGEIQASDVDIEMGESASAISSLHIDADTVNIDRFAGRSLSISSDDLTITGPVAGSGTFQFNGKSSKTIGLGSAAGDLQFSKSILEGITGFWTFDIGTATGPGSDIAIDDAALNFNSVTLRGSSIDIDTLEIGINLKLVTDFLNVQNQIVKASDSGTLTFDTMTSSQSIGLGDATVGGFNVTADEFDFLGTYNYLWVTGGSGDVRADMDFTGKYATGITIDAVSGNAFIDEVTTDSGFFKLTSGDIYVASALTGDAGNTDLQLFSGSSSMAVAAASAGVWNLDSNEFDRITNFESVTFQNTSSSGLLEVAGADFANPVDFGTITTGAVNLLSDWLVISDIKVPEALSISVFGPLDINGAVTTENSDSFLTINAGRVSSTSGSRATSVGLGSDSTGAIHLSDAEINNIVGFDTIDVDHVSASTPGTTTINATFDKNLKVSGSRSIDVTSLTTTGGSNIDLATAYQSGGTGNIGTDKIDVTNINASGDIKLDAAQVEINGVAQTTQGDVLVDATRTAIGNGTQTSAVSLGSANGSTTVNTETLTIDASASASAQLGFAFTDTTSDVNGDIAVNASGDIVLTGNGTHFATIGHGDAPGNDDTGKSVAGDVTVSGSKNVSITKGHIGHMIDAGGTYASGSTMVYAGLSDFSEDNPDRDVDDFHQPYIMISDAESEFVSAAFADDGKLGFYVPDVSQFHIDPDASLNGGHATGSVPTNYGGPSDPNNDYAGEYVGDAGQNWSIFSAPIGLEIQIGDSASVYGADIIDFADVTLLGDNSNLFGATTEAELNLAADYDGLSGESDAGTTVLQIKTDDLKKGYYVKRIYREGETFGSGPGTTINTAGTHTITPAELTIQIDSQTKQYGDLFTWDGTEFDATGLVNGQTIDTLTLGSDGAAATANVTGGPYSITSTAITGSDFKSSNYDIHYSAGALSVTRAPLTVNLNPITKAVGLEANLTGREFSIIGLKNNDLVESITQTSDGIPAEAIVGVYELLGSHPIGSVFDATNYEITIADSTLTVLSPTNNTAHDVWSRAGLAAGSVNQLLGGGVGSINSSQQGSTSVELSDSGLGSDADAPTSPEDSTR